MHSLIKIGMIQAIIFANLLYAQKEIAFEHISIPEGLSNPQVFALIQDRYGYLWIGTQDGLNRYDGYQFVTYRNEPNDTSSIMDNMVFTALEDSNGTLWFGTSSGLSRYNRDSDNFTNFHPVPVSAAIPNQFVFAIGEKDRNHLWIGCNLGLYLMDTKSNTFKPQFMELDDVEKEIPSMISLISYISDNRLLVYSIVHGIMEYDEQNSIFRPVSIKTGPAQMLRNKWILSIYEDKAKNIWLAGQAGFFKYMPENQSIEYIDLFNTLKVNPQEPVVSKILPITDDQIWATTLAGLYKYHINDGTFEHFSHNPAKKNSLSSNYLFNIVKDRAGVLWIASQGGGINKFDPQKEPFNFYSLKPPSADETATNPVSGFTPVNNQIKKYWISTISGGLYEYDHETHQHRSWQNNSGKSNSISSNNLSTVYQAKNNIVWIGTNGAGLDRFDPSKNQFKNYRSDPAKAHTLSDNNLSSILEDSLGIIWIGTGFGLNRFDPKTERFELQPAIRTRTYPAAVNTLIDSLYKRRRPLSAIAMVGDNENISKKFQLERPKNVVVISAGEGLAIWGMVDFGWLQSAGGDTVWAMNRYESSFYFDGEDKNRIQIQTLRLDPGTYTLCYRSDDSHSYGHWNAPAPADSFLWGIHLFDLNDDDFSMAERMIENETSRKIADYSNVNDILIEKNKYLWLATNQGLIKYEIQTRNSEAFLADNVTINSVTNNIRDIHRDNDGILWLASDGGLYRFDPVTREILLFTQTQGLPSPYIRGILEDDQHDLWLSSASGIFRLKKPERLKKLSLVKYDIKDGLQGYLYFAGSSYKAADGESVFRRYQRLQRLLSRSDQYNTTGSDHL